MKVYYRMCDIPSTNSPPIYKDNKKSLNRLCLESFVKAYSETKPPVTFLNDYCPPDYTDMILEVVPTGWQFTIEYSEIGIDASCKKQYDYALESQDEVILFQECDYFHLAPITEVMVRELGFVTPYDHPDKYDLNERSLIRISDNHHFKTTVSTTSTFATTKAQIESYKDTFYKFGYIDHARWLEIGELGGVLYSAIPALATHMVELYLSPSIEWKNHFIQ